MAVELAVQDDLERRLHDLRGGAVELVQEEDHRPLAGLLVPVRRGEPGDAVDQLGETDQVALRHLAEAAIQRVQSELLADEPRQGGLADTVRAAEQHRDGGGEDRKDADEGLDFHADS